MNEHFETLLYAKDGRNPRIARITLKEDAVDQTLVFRATATSAPWFFVKRVLIAKAQ
jgi:hypothetical protein